MDSEGFFLANSRTGCSGRREGAWYIRRLCCVRGTHSAVPPSVPEAQSWRPPSLPPFSHSENGKRRQALPFPPSGSGITLPLHHVRPSSGRLDLWSDHISPLLKALGGSPSASGQSLNPSMVPCGTGGPAPAHFPGSCTSIRLAPADLLGSCASIWLAHAFR